MTETYRLKYYKTFRSRQAAGGELFQLEIHQRGLDASFRALEIGDWQGLSLEVDGDDDPVSPIQKTIVTFYMVDSSDRPDTAGVKYGNWQEFYTPDSTLYKVVIRKGEEGSDIWTGYITPDNWQESLDYRGTVTVTARDNIGHLQDFEFDMQADKAGTVRVAALIRAALDKVAYPMDMSILLSTDEDTEYRGIVYQDEVPLPDFRVNVSHFDGKTWQDAFEEVLSSLGLCFRYIGGNRALVTYLRYLPLLGAQRRDTVTAQPVVFTGGGTRSFSPAYRKIVDTLKYDFEEDAAFAANEGLTLGTEASTYQTDILVTTATRPYASVRIAGAVAANTNTGDSGWESGDGFGPVLGRTSEVLDLDSVALLAANEQTAGYVFVYRLGVLLPGLSGELTLSFESCPALYAQRRGRAGAEYVLLAQTTVAGSAGTEQRRAYTPRLASMKYAIIYETAAGETWYKSSTGWQKETAVLDYDGSGGESSSVSFSLQAVSTVAEQALMNTPGRLRLVISDIAFSLGDTNIISTPQGCGIYLAVTGITLTAESGSRIESDTTTTVNDDGYNVTESRSPELGFLSRRTSWQTPQNYGNALYCEDEDGLVSPVTYRMRWDGDANDEPFPALLHRQILQYHHSTMQLLEGDCMPATPGPWDFGSVVTYKGHRFLLQGGTYDFVSGILSGARLREYESYEDLWSVEPDEPGTPDTAKWSVTITDIGPNKIQVIKALRDSAGLSLSEAKALVESTPAVIGSGYTRAQAEGIAKAVEAAGGAATLTESN